MMSNCWYTMWSFGQNIIIVIYIYTCIYFFNITVSIYSSSKRFIGKWLKKRYTLIVYLHLKHNVCLCCYIYCIFKFFFVLDMIIWHCLFKLFFRFVVLDVINMIFQLKQYERVPSGKHRKSIEHESNVPAEGLRIFFQWHPSVFF